MVNIIFAPNSLIYRGRWEKVFFYKQFTRLVLNFAEKRMKIRLIPNDNDIIIIRDNDFKVDICCLFVAIAIFKGVYVFPTHI